MIGYDDIREVDTSGDYDNIKGIYIQEDPNLPAPAAVTVYKGRETIVHWPSLNDDVEIRELILKHEVGHLYYNHLKAAPQLMDQVRSYEPDMRVDKITYLLNVAMDMQINSTLLNLEEVEKIEGFLKVALGKDTQSVHPSRVGFPEGLTTEEYIDRLMILRQEQGQSGQDDKDQGGGQGDGEGDQSDSQQSGEYGDTQITVSEEKYKELREQMQTYGTDTSNDQDRNRGNSANFYGELELEPELTAIQKLSQIIKPYMKRIKRSYRLDRNLSRNVYKNTLRGRSPRMYIPSYATQVTRVYEKGAVDFLVDVSSSTSPDVNKKIVRDTFELISTPGRFMAIYMWNTDLMEKVTAQDLKDLDNYKFRVGGGTDLADGITYIRKQSKELRPLVIISDLEDDLKAWSKALTKAGYNFDDVLILSHGDMPGSGIDLPRTVKLPKEYSM